MKQLSPILKSVLPFVVVSSGAVYFSLEKAHGNSNNTFNPDLSTDIWRNSSGTTTALTCHSNCHSSCHVSCHSSCGRKTW